MSFRILLVEDHDDTVRVTKIILEREGHRVTSAGSVAEALQLARNSLFDLAIIDGKLPDGTGWELLPELRKIQPLPAIAVTAHAMKQDVQRSIDVGFCVHLSKPIEVSALRSAIRACADAQSDLGQDA
jgi:CheY-like chemotaxis protein